MFYLTTHSTHFIYGYIVSDICKWTIQIVREETRCRHMGFSLRLATRILLYAPSHRQDSTNHSLCYNKAQGIDPTTHRTKSERSYYGATSRSRLSQRNVWDCVGQKQLTMSFNLIYDFGTYLTQTLRFG